jgi:two-component sensor histidine kinase
MQGSNEMTVSHDAPDLMASRSLTRGADGAKAQPDDSTTARLEFLLNDIGRPSAPDRDADGADRDADVDLRQLRHHTKNALQRIISLVLQVPGLRGTAQGDFLLRQLESRIQLSAAVSDALFGLTRAPEPMTDRLRSLCGNLVELLREPTQVIQVGVSVRGDCPVHLREPVLRVAHELVGNAVKHGMRMRQRGRITVRLQTEPGVRTRLTVIDDGNGFHGNPRSGEGLDIADMFASQYGGTLNLQSDGRTVATLDLPHTPPE